MIRHTGSSIGFKSSRVPGFQILRFKGSRVLVFEGSFVLGFFGWRVLWLQASRVPEVLTRIRGFYGSMVPEF